MELTDFGDRIAKRAGHLVVLNDEAHHTHDEESEWNNVIRTLHKETPLAAQLDFSATPRFQKGAIFPWTISDYPFKQAILDNIVKRPMKGIAHIEEAKSDCQCPIQRISGCGGRTLARIPRQLSRSSKAGAVRHDEQTPRTPKMWGLVTEKYPAEFGGDKTQVIHTDKSGEVSKKDLDRPVRQPMTWIIRRARFNAIVSVLMLREGWDVQNVTVVVGFRPYTAKANILPEQAIGRGLRLMFREARRVY